MEVFSTIGMLYHMTAIAVVIFMLRACNRTRMTSLAMLELVSLVIDYAITWLIDAVRLGVLSKVFVECHGLERTANDFIEAYILTDCNEV